MISNAYCDARETQIQLATQELHEHYIDNFDEDVFNLLEGQILQVAGHEYIMHNQIKSLFLLLSLLAVLVYLKQLFKNIASDAYHPLLSICFLIANNMINLFDAK